ncbi:MAG: DNA (cytosine-5-)-methyltransferase [Clostridiales bacterium]|jgi:DNA (cytosine-5)-methyltransferase 1|nr:DNA (cytosine-5-)-methyltransferase [Clostridiales bacterium]
MERIKHVQKKYSVVSLFSGIGGLDLGFEYAGFNLVWANDFDKYAVQTYQANVGRRIVLGDIRNEKENIPDHDVLVAGFPCQSFSTLGNLKGFDDEERGGLFFEIKEIAKQHKTKALVLENVKNIMNHDNGKTFKRILHELHSIGYDCYYEVLNSADFGIPQRRNRVYIVALRRENFEYAEFDYPKGFKLTATTQDLLDRKVDSRYFLSKKIEKTILGEGTKGYIVKPTIDLPISKTLCASMHKMHRASQDNYVTDIVSRALFEDDNKTVLRKLTPDECRKLQGFPMNWKQVVSDCQAYKQFGNAVTVDVAYAVAKNLMEHMDANLIKENEVYYAVTK